MVGPPTAPEIEGAELFKATFDEVKADLAAAGRRSLCGDTHEFISSQNRISGFPSRAQIVQSKIQDLNSRIAAAQSQLDSHMRSTRNIATLTPFQKSTRDRLTIALQGIARRVGQIRLEITKLTCHRNVLLRDLICEEESRQRTKALALEAAKEIIHNQARECSTCIPLRTCDSTAMLTLEGTLFPDNGQLNSRPESSISGSFHTALECRVDSQLFEDASLRLDPQASSGTSIVSSSSRGGVRSSSPPPSLSITQGVHDIVSTSDHLGTTPARWCPEVSADKVYPPRISLVRIPSDMNLMTLFQGDKGSED